MTLSMGFQHVRLSLEVAARIRLDARLTCLDELKAMAVLGKMGSCQSAMCGIDMRQAGCDGLAIPTRHALNS